MRLRLTKPEHSTATYGADVGRRLLVLAGACLVACAGAFFSAGLVPAEATTPAASESTASQDEPAREASAWRVSPIVSTAGEFRNYFILDADPGDAIADVLVVENLSSEPRELQVYGQEARLTPDGKYSAPPGRAVEGSFGTWIRPSVDTVTVEPYAKVEVPFSIAIPQGATPGDYDGAVFTTLASPADQGGEQVVVDFRVGVRVHLRVAGDVAPGLEVSDVEPVRLTAWWNPLPADVGVSFTVTNTGNVRVTGRAVSEVVADYVWRTERQSGIDSVETPELLPGSSVVFSAEPAEGASVWAQGPYFTKLWGFGKQSYTVRIVNAEVPNSDTQVPSVAATAEIWVMPWIPLAVVLIALVLLVRRGYRRIFAVRIARRRAAREARRAARRTGGKPDPSETVDQGSPAGRDAGEPVVSASLEGEDAEAGPG